MAAEGDLVIDTDHGDGSALMVLGWHNIEPTWHWPAPVGAGRAGFARQLRALRRVANVVPLEQALQDLVAGRRLPPRAVAITFDDGYRDNLDVAVPVLRSLGLPATIFLIPDLLDGTMDPWWERLAWAVRTADDRVLAFEGATYALTDARTRTATLERLEERLKTRTDAQRRSAVHDIVASLRPGGAPYRPGDLFLDREGARQLVRAGVTIGSHTTHHVILARETARAQEDDLREARIRLQDQLDVPVDALAYPNGLQDDYDATTVGAARNAGHTSAVTAWGLVNFSDTPPFEVRRRLVSPLDRAATVVLGMAYRARRDRRQHGRPPVPRSGAR